MEIGIIGPPQSGRTTLLRTLTGSRGEAVGVAKVPDPRLEALARLLKPKKLVPAEVRYRDTPPQGPAAMAPVDGFLCLLPAFRQPGEGAGEYLRQWRSFQSDLILSDLAVVERRLERVETSLRTGKGEREPLQRERELLSRIKAALEKEAPARELPLSESEWKMLSGFNLLTARPVMAVLNIAEADLPLRSRLEAEWRELCPAVRAVALCVRLEGELAELPPEDAGEFRRALGAETSGVERLIRMSCQLLDMVFFFTVVSDEVRAWPVPRGTAALRAAGRVHSDMERGFIRAEVIGFEELVECGSFAEARKRGKLRLEGKNYTVQDGDIITFLFHV